MKKYDIHGLKKYVYHIFYVHVIFNIDLNYEEQP